LAQVQIEAKPATTEWHCDEELEVGRVEKLKEEEEEAPEMRREKVEALALDIEVQEMQGWLLCE
jgi:hypothetical protein